MLKIPKGEKFPNDGRTHDLQTCGYCANLLHHVLRHRTDIKLHEILLIVSKNDAFQ